VAARPEVFGWQQGPATAALTRGGLVVPALAETDAELAAMRDSLRLRTRALRRSVHIRHVDAGSDGSEEWEVNALLNPVYDVHRLGVFFTASPRHADVLLVTGAGARGMAEPLRRTYHGMPDPKIVVAAGTDAVSGGLLAGSDATHGGVGEIVPVDVWVPGSPPSPFALLHGLLLGLGRLADGSRSQEVAR
jgi:Ni,Fe-hydrogenase III small subunit